MRRFHIAMLALAAGLLAGPSSGQEPKNYALLVGVKEYDGTGLTDLNYTENDVEELAEVLIGGDYEPDRVVVMTFSKAGDEGRFDLMPTAENIRAKLGAMLQAVGPDDRVLVAFSGHGVQFDGEEEHYFVPTGAKLEADARDSLVAIGAVYDALDTCAANQKILIVDACRNDPHGAGGKGVLDFDLPKRYKAPPPGLVALYSCRAGQQSFEDAASEHGVFFRYIIAGLRGAADPSGTGVVKADDLHRYITSGIASDATLPEAAKGAERRSLRDYVSAVLLKEQTPDMQFDGEAMPTLITYASLEFFLNRGNARFKAGEAAADRDPGRAAIAFREALAEFDSAVRRSEGDLTLYHLRGKARLALAMAQADAEDRDPSAELLDQAADDYERAQLQLGEYHFEYATVAHLLGDFEKASYHADRAIRRGFESAEAFTKRAEIRLAQAGVEGTADTESLVPIFDDLDRAVELAPSDPMPRLLRGHARLVRNDDPGDVTAAIDDLRRAVELGLVPKLELHARWLLGNALDARGEHGESIRDWSRAMALAQAGREPTLELICSCRRGVASYLLGELEAARADLERVVRSNPPDDALMVEASSYLGRALLDLGRPREAIAPLNNALRFADEGGSPPILLRRGLAYLALGDHQGAAKDLSIAIDRLADDAERAEALRARARCFEAAGDADQAGADRKRADSLAPAPR